MLYTYTVYGKNELDRWQTKRLLAVGGAPNKITGLQTSHASSQSLPPRVILLGEPPPTTRLVVMVVATAGKATAGANSFSPYI